MLTITDLAIRFPGENGETCTALTGINLQVPDGQFICILGPSGCGKTTLLRIIAGLQGGYTGTINYDSGDFGLHTAMVFQEHALFPWLTVEKNVIYGLNLSVRKAKTPEDRKERARKYLDLCQMADAAESYPHQLSGGMRQRVAVARALAVEPEVLLMDEPFSALDPTTRTQLQNEVIRIHQVTRKTIICVTHNMEEAALLGDRVLILSNSPGSIVADIMVTQPHPRDPDDPAIIKIKKELAGMIQERKEG